MTFDAIWLTAELRRSDAISRTTISHRCDMQAAMLHQLPLPTRHIDLAYNWRNKTVIGRICRGSKLDHWGPCWTTESLVLYELRPV